MRLRSFIFSLFPVISSLVISMPINAANDDAMVISATRMPAPASSVSNSVTVIGEKEMERKQQINVREAVEETPGVNAVQTAPNSTSSVFIRGAKSEHTLMLWDGIEISNPTAPGGGFDYYNFVPTSNVERIEIIRGPHSVLYGSRAIGGVINIIPRKGGENRIGLGIASGSFNTHEASAQFSGQVQNFYYGIGLLGRKSDGFSAASERDGNNEKDGYEHAGGNINLGYKTETFDIGLLTLSSRTESDLDGYDQNGQFGDDPNYTATVNFYTVGLKGGVWYAGGDQHTQVTVAETNYKYKSENKANDAADTSTSSANNTGKLSQIDLQQDMRFGVHTITIGGAQKEETAEMKAEYSGFPSEFPEEKQSLTGIYLQEQWQPGPFSAVIGVRQDSHSKWNSNTTYRAGVGHLFPSMGMTVKANYGTGFQAPTLYQLYDPTYGNKELKPETSQGFDVGVANHWSETLKSEVTFFHNRFEDMITFVNNTHENLGEAKAFGVESNAAWRATTNFEWTLGYTYTEAKDGDKNELLRRPKHTGSTAFTFFASKSTTTLQVLGKGKRRETIGFSQGVVPAYGVANLIAKYDATSFLQVYLRIYNLFDTDYEEVPGYTSPGINGMGGVQFTL